MSRPGRRPASRRLASCRLAVRRVAVRRLAVRAGLVGLAVSTSACGTAAAGASAPTSTTVPWVVGTGGTLTVGIDAPLTGCNPDTAAGDTWADRLVLAPVLPSAFQVNSKDQPAYDSAVITQAELQSTTPQTVVYTIDPNAVWSDGTPISAADFIYTWREERGTAGAIESSGSGTASPGSATGTTPASTGTTATVGPTTLPGATGTTGTLMGYRQIESVKGSNAGKTVTVVFKSPYADWKALFDDLLPAHVLKKTGWSPACTSLDPSIDLSGGPYVIRSVAPGQEVVLARNPRWWGTRPNLNEIVIKTADSEAQLASWLATGKVQVAVPASFDEQFLQRVSASPKVASQEGLSTTFLQLELSATSPLTSSVDVRAAVAHAIGRQQLVNQVVGWADTSVVPAASHLYAEDQNGYPSPKQLPIQITDQSSSTTTTTLPSTPTPAQPFPTTADPATAARLLTEAGYVRRPDGTWLSAFGKVLTLQVAVDSATPWATRAAPIIEHQLAGSGIGVQFLDEPTATATGVALSSGAADAALLPMHASPYSTTAIAWYTELLGPPGQSGSQDWTNFVDPSLDNLLVKASQQLNPVDASPIYTQADMVLWQQMVDLPLFTEPDAVAWSAAIGGVTPDFNGPNLLTTVATWGVKVPPTSPRAQGGSDDGSPSSS